MSNQPKIKTMDNKIFVRTAGSMVVTHEISEYTTCIHICFAGSDAEESSLLHATFAWAHKQYEQSSKDTFIDVTIRGGGGDLVIANSMARLLAREKSFNRFHVIVTAADLASAGIYYMQLLDNAAFCYGSHATTVDGIVTEHPYTDYTLHMLNIDQNVANKDHQWVQVADNVSEYYKNRANGYIDNKVYIKDLRMLFVSMPPTKYAEELAEFNQEEIGSDKWYDELMDLVYVNWCNLIFHKADYPLPKSIVTFFRRFWATIDPKSALPTYHVPKWMAKQSSRKRWLPCVDAYDLACSLAAYIIDNGQRYQI